jgi:hypothetical protein
VDIFCPPGAFYGRLFDTNPGVLTESGSPDIGLSNAPSIVGKYPAAVKILKIENKSNI